MTQTKREGCNFMVHGLPMPCRVELVFPDGSREELSGVVVPYGSNFQDAAVAAARERGAVAEFVDGFVRSTSQRAL